MRKTRKHNQRNTVARAHKVVELAEAYYEPENLARCWHRTWERYVLPVYPIIYATFKRYLRIVRHPEESGDTDSRQLTLFDILS